MKNPTKKLTNHVVFVLDESSSMHGIAREVTKVVDAQVAYLALRSQEMNQETRVTVYTFASRDNIECVYYDMDVLRLPSIKDHYRPSGMTALIKATTKALSELAETPERYGDHAFLVYVLTDGQENDSYTDGPWSTTRMAPSALLGHIAGLPGHWTVAALVPNVCDTPERERCGYSSEACGVHAARQCGFANNVAVWDATSAEGVKKVGEKIRQATDAFMENRAKDVRGTTKLFDIGASVVNADAILAAGYTRVEYDEYELIPVPPKPPKVSDEEWALKHPGKRRKPPLPWGGEIGDFVRKVNGGSYKIGQAYYPLTDDRSFIVQPNKVIMILDTQDSRVYRGSRAAAHRLLDLPEDKTVRIKPTSSERFRVYVKSTSDNRSLSPRAPLLLFKSA